MPDEPTESNAAPSPSRRDIVARATSVAMVGGLAASYGAAGLMAGRYLYPAKPRETRWLFVAVADELEEGTALVFRTPTGEPVTVARKGMAGDVSDFVALSSTCPHLGCQVHWQQQEARFFCPCHNGTFAPDGTATGGPPADSKQDLPRYPLRIEAGLLYIETPVEKLADASGTVEAPGGPPGPGHDPCLHPETRKA